ncbi:MAG: complexin-2 [Eubacteriales bacterium]
MKNIQIPEELFIALVKYHLLDLTRGEEQIKQPLMDKMDRIAIRELYTQYKTAPSDEEKEKARQEYLDKRGVTKDFRW